MSTPLTEPVPAVALPARHPLVAPLAMLAAVVFWGGSFTATKAAVAEVPPVLFALARFVLASGVMLSVHAVLRRPVRAPRSLWGVIVAVGLIGTTATYVMENVALTMTTSGNSSLLIAISPLLTAIAAVIFLGERLSLRMLAGALVAAVGVALLVGGDVAHTGVGDAIMLATTAIGVAYNLLSKRLADAMAPMSALTTTFLVGTAGLIPCALVEARWFPAPVHPGVATLSALAYLGLGSSCMACWLWMYALARMPASRAVLFLYVMPLVTLFSGHVMLGEHLGLDTALEALLILVGVYAATTAGTPAAQERPASPSDFADARKV